MDGKPYKTLIREASDEFIVHKSRFIGHGRPVQTQEEALEFLARKRAEYKDATHNCYAYIVGTNMGIMRYSDDGEPSGTAGMPIIEVLKARGVTNCAVVVTRYFGGILLGAGGLVRAYSKGASLALEAAGVGVMYPTKRVLVDIAYPQLSRFEHMLKAEPVQVEEKTFADTITFTIVVKAQDAPKFAADLLAMSDGRTEPLEIEEMYLPWQEECAEK